MTRRNSAANWNETIAYLLFANERVIAVRRPAVFSQPLRKNHVSTGTWRHGFRSLSLSRLFDACRVVVSKSSLLKKRTVKERQTLDVKGARTLSVT